MAIGITQIDTFSTGTSETVEVALTVAANSWLVVTFSDGDGTNRVATCSSSPSCSWTVRQDQTSGYPNNAVAFAFFAAGGSITVSPVFTSTSAGKRSACLYELSGCEGTAGGAYAVNGDPSATTTPSTNITTTRTDSLLIGVCGNEGAVQGAYTLRTPPTLTLDFEHNGGVGTNRAYHLSSNGVSVATHTVGLSAPANQSWSAAWLEMRVGGAALTGTALSSISEQDIKDGSKTIIITLTGTTWVAS